MTRHGIRLIAILCLLLPAARGVPIDVDADGTADLWLSPDDPLESRIEDRNEDGRLEWGATGSTPVDRVRYLPEIDFDVVWKSGTTLNTIWTVEAGDADRDGVFDFAGAEWNPNVIHLFESDGGGGYDETWDSSESTPPGAYRDIAFADTDGDDQGEILGGEVSTLGKVMLFEEGESGFDFLHDDIRESDFVDGRSIRSVLVGDTDLNDRQEVIVATGSSYPTGGVVAIWEHSGVIGENTYTRIFAYETVSYLFGAALGDADNDGYPEIVLGLGGFGGNPLIIRRIEFDPREGTWVHSSFTSSIIGLPLTPRIGDFDEDDENELAFGSSGFMVIYECTGDNTFSPRFTTAEPLAGNVLCLDHRRLSIPGTETLAVGSFDGDVALWSFDPDLDTFQRIFARDAIGGAVRGLALADDGSDGLEELLLAVAGSIDQVWVMRRRVSGEVTDVLPGGSGPHLVDRNPSTNGFRFRVSPAVTHLSICDLQGRPIRRIDVCGGIAQWDGRDATGRRARAGRYWARSRHGEAIPLLMIH